MPGCASAARTRLWRRSGSCGAAWRLKLAGCPPRAVSADGVQLPRLVLYSSDPLALLQEAGALPRPFGECGGRSIAGGIFQPTPSPEFSILSLLGPLLL